MASFRSHAVRLFRRLVSSAGGVLLSAAAHRQLIMQRARAVTALADIESQGLRQGLAGIVLSKDRALQLYTLLSTYFKHVTNPAPLTILYAASTSRHATAYLEVQDVLAESGLNVAFVREGPVFKDSLLAVLQEISSTNIFFLVDDIIFIRPVDLKFASELDPRKAVLSLRHSPNLRRSYTAGVLQLPPNFARSKSNSDLLEFCWFEQGNEWADPWSVDGQVLSTAEIRVLTRISSFAAPNSYEGALKTFGDMAASRTGLCYTESKILNLPINRVQNEVENCSGSVSAEYLLDHWSKGLMLDTSMFDSHVPESPHENHAVEFTKRPKTFCAR